MTGEDEPLVREYGDGYRALRLKRIDGEPAPSSPLAPLLIEEGFAEDYLSLVFSR